MMWPTRIRRTETVTIADRVPIPWTTKINPVWWLPEIPDSWEDRHSSFLTN